MTLLAAYRYRSPSIGRHCMRSVAIMHGVAQNLRLPEMEAVAAYRRGDHTAPLSSDIAQASVGGAASFLRGGPEEFTRTHVDCFRYPLLAVNARVIIL